MGHAGPHLRGGVCVWGGGGGLKGAVIPLGISPFILILFINFLYIFFNYYYLFFLSPENSIDMSGFNLYGVSSHVYFMSNIQVI